MKKCKCPYVRFNYMGHEEIEIVDCLVYNHEIGEHYECYCNNKKESELYYGNCCLYKLQSKIDKANKLLEELEIRPAYLDCKYYELEGFKELKDILKEI